MAQAIPNSSFENWTQVPSAPMKNPTDWGTSNIKATGVNVETVTKDSLTPHTGSYCAKLTSVKPMPFVNSIAPGLLTTGKFNMNLIAQTGTVSGGIPWTSRPQKFKGFFKSAPASGDQVFIACVLFKTNTATGKPDTVGQAYFTSTQTINTWTEWNIDFTYRTNDTPDTLNVIFMSSDGRFTPKQGSVLYVDDVSVEGLATEVVEEVRPSKTSVYPNPATNMFIVESSNAISQIIVRDILGKVVEKQTLVNAYQKAINCESYNMGIYIVEIHNSIGVETRKIVIK